ncbi:MAG: sulfatase-like hydrolase/transferase [Elusimicrobiaceae bacterium]|nr:sulfatase-like hydrolase/transferase [Elusimicrobiaceae bacterium]
MKKLSCPTRFKAYFIFVGITFLLMALMRIVFYFVNTMGYQEGVLKALYTGFRFDIRIAFLFSLPFGLFLLLPAKKIFKQIISILYAILFAALVLVYFFDFGYYAYLTQRLNAYIFELAQNTATSLEMVWQSYPVIKGALALLIIVFIGYLLTRKIANYAYSKQGGRKGWVFVLIALIITAAFIHGRFSQYPLRWSNAYFTTDNFLTSLALNPLHNLYDTYKFAKAGSGFDTAKTKEYYDITAEFLGVKNKDKENLNFTREIEAKNPKQYNVVILLVESLAWDKTSFNAPEIDPTPKAALLAKEGTLFTRFFTPTIGTARGVFNSITGVADTSAVKTSSRNPMIVSQHSLINDLAGYKKFYFIGGSTNWGNVRGLLQYNIDNLKIFEEGTYENQDRNDVWGLSDLDMFRYAARELANTKEPFFAFIQTSGYHRPYTIPEDHGTFEVKELEEDTLKEYGFSGNKEYNSMRFQDYAMGEFFDLIKKEPFYKDTIFLIYGDHGLTSWKSKNLKQSFIDLELTANNVPLIVLGPGIKKEVNPRVASQVDVTATMAGLLGIKHNQTGLGRNIFDNNQEEGALIINHPATPLKIGFVQDDYYYLAWPGKEGLFKYNEDSSKDYCLQNKQKCDKMKNLTQGLYEAARYITFHHKQGA